MAEAYARLVLALSEHTQYQTSGAKSRAVGGGLRRREFAKHSRMDTYTRGGKESYWINEHHRACFASAYPNAYDKIFESAGPGEELLSKADFSLFQALPNRPATRQSLLSKGLMTDETSYTIGIGAGRYANALASVAWPADFPLHS